MEDNETVVATYKTHVEAEDAIQRLHQGGLPVDRISVMGRDWQVREDVQGYYHPGGAAVEGAQEGAWLGGLFGLLMGFGFFLIPVVGPLLVLGPLAGVVAGAAGGAGVGALVRGLTTLGLPEHQALKYQRQLTAGEFLVVVHGTASDGAKAREVLQNTGHTALETHKPGAA